MAGANIPIVSPDAEYPEPRFRIILVKEIQ
jgi:hypothetical protein